ncbi:MAG: ATP-binding protein [Acidimicrobiia bacterium]
MGQQTSRAQTAGREFSPTPDAAPAAREFVVSFGGFTDAESLLRLKTLASEIVTNAILHARTPFSVIVTGDTAHVRVAVRDRSAVLPTKRDYAANHPTGRGLHIVEALADRWGVDADDDGKTVWFEMDRESAGVA